MQVILDSSFARPGSPSIWGGMKGEFRDWTILLHETLVNSLFSGTFSCCSPTHPNDVSLKCFISEMLTVNAMKTRCSSIVIIISCSRSRSTKTPVDSFSNIQNNDDIIMELSGACERSVYNSQGQKPHFSHI